MSIKDCVNTVILAVVAILGFYCIVSVLSR